MTAHTRQNHDASAREKTSAATNREAQPAPDSLETAFRALQPAPPPNLRARCLPSETTPIPTQALLDRPSSPSILRKYLNRSTALAAAASLAFVALYLVWGFAGVSTASAKVLQSALDSLSRVQAVHITYDLDTGPDTPVTQAWHMWASATAGFRFQRGRDLQVYSAADETQYTYDSQQNQLTSMSATDPGILAEFLRRCQADRNIEALRVCARQPSAGLRDETLTRDGREVRRISATDEFGQPLAVEIDPSTNRVLRSEAWTLEMPDVRPVRAVVVFDYPTPDSLDPALFAAPDVPTAQRIVRPPIQMSIQQISINVRTLCMAVQIYAQDHDGTLPPNVRDLAPYCPNEDIDALLTHVMPHNGQLTTVKYLFSTQPNSQAPGNSDNKTAVLPPNAQDSPQPSIQNPKSEIQNPDSQLQTPTSKLETQNSKLKTRNPKLETSNSKLETPNSKLQTPNSNLETSNSNLETQNSKLETRKLSDLPPDTILFECPLPGGVVRGFADSHAEFIANDTTTP